MDEATERGTAQEGEPAAGWEADYGAASGQPSRKKRGKRIAAIALAIVAVAAIGLGVFVAYSFSNGDLVPADAAAKYSGMNYLPEGEVTDYIATYREQMNLADASDEDWATFLAAYNLTPQRLRLSTIDQLLKDNLVEKKATELGLSASDEEVDATIQTLKNSYALGSDDVLLDTLASHGQSMEGLREVYRQAILKRLVLSSEVPTPDPTDEQVKDFMKSYDSSLSNSTLKHTYCLRLGGPNQDGSSEALAQIQLLCNEFASGEHSVEVFNTMVQAFCDDDNLVANGGANGWDADSGNYSEMYASKLEDMEVDDVSDVFIDGDSYAFIWLDSEYTLPSGSDAIDALDPDDMPESLWRYLSELTAYQLWEDAGQDYLDQLLADAQVVYYPMPADVPYNVDMSLADVQLEEVEP